MIIKRLNLYQTISEFEINLHTLLYPSVSYVREDGNVYVLEYEKYLKLHSLTFTAEEDNSTIGLEKLSTNQTLEYSADATTWNTFDTTTNISLNNGDKVYIRGILSSNNSTSSYTQFKMTGKIAASGNCNALWNYNDLEAPLKGNCGRKMFLNCTSLTTAPELPATRLANNCYYEMFSDCESLTSPPELPATTLAYGCYEYMFSNCTSLTIAPELPATTLAELCYCHMFSNCTSLTIAPELPATKLAVNCYSWMFYNCISLTTATDILPAIELAEGCYNIMFCNCKSLTIAPLLPATTLADFCYNSMFCDCTSLTTAPELPAAVLAEGCYYLMFSGCTELNHIKCLATNISANNCIASWVYNVSPTGTFVKHPDMNDWTAGTSGIPEGWVVEDADLPYVTFTAEEDNSSIGLAQLSTNQTLNYSTDTINWEPFNTTTNITLINVGDKVYIRGVLSADNTSSNYTRFEMSGKIAGSGNCNAIWNYQDLNAPLKKYCGSYMFSYCTSLTTAPELPATELADFCYNRMFRGCTSLTTAPVLPATTLAVGCYFQMFWSCSNLNHIKCLATNIVASCVTNWVNGVASTGTFIKHPDMNDWPIDSDSGIPDGWTVENYAEQ